ncbi:MAG: long-chain fatty acid--CoA ligase, partial [Cyanobacteria bacterium]|nr:long-chain fatty acid--CoA ligase [Cyanobacteriota bacterium]MDW8201808.1 long-chain fatty acid--CoA ligase [Cyanobacteriota bacterium SKYGB_h_bin112]
MPDIPRPAAMTERERRALQQVTTFPNVQSVADIWAIVAQQHPNILALHDPHSKPEVKLTYAQLYEQMQQFAAGLQALGVQAGQCIALIADNSPRWFIADQGTMMAGAVNAVRSAQADTDEVLFILRNSGSTLLIAETIALWQRLRAGLNDLPIHTAILLSDETPDADQYIKVLNFAQVMELGASHSLQPVQRHLEDLATLIYTSGTTGKPKGVMLSHGNLMYQINTTGVIVQPQPGDRVLSILPTWHSYERTCEYFLLSQGCTQIYTNIRHIKQDLKQYKPHYMVAVPRIWESIYEGIQKQFREQPPSKQKLVNSLLDASHRYVRAKRLWQGLDLQNLTPSLGQRLMAGLQTLLYAPLHALGNRLVYKKVREATGGNIKYVISGGGALASHLDTFFEVVGIEILVGYGLTETSPILSARRSWYNLRGSSGKPYPGTELRIVHPETRTPLPAGQRGLVLARGPQVMQGYYQNPEATQKAIDADGWFDTGDLGFLTPGNDIVLTGRAKDTIVLSNGENIEPQPIEDACLRSPFIDQIMLVGQDKKMLGALIVPNLDVLTQWATAQGIATEPALDLEAEAVQELFRRELTREVKNRPGYRPDDRIGVFRLITEPFSV